MKFPEIKIFYSYLIDPFFIGYNKHYTRGGWDRWSPPTNDKILQKTTELREEWEKYEEKILTAIYKITNIEFKRNIIDVHIISGSPRNMSSPLIISSHNPTKDFINTLTHELIHKLFTDNVKGKVYRNIFIDMFPNETKLTQNHIIVHAILKYIYLDILKDEKRFKDNIKKSERTPDYKKAWEIVEKEGYLNLIEKFKKNYPLV
jgi:hypothetical protein